MAPKPKIVESADKLKGSVVTHCRVSKPRLGELVARCAMGSARQYLRAAPPQGTIQLAWRTISFAGFFCESSPRASSIVHTCSVPQYGHDTHPPTTAEHLSVSMAVNT